VLAAFGLAIFQISVSPQDAIQVSMIWGNQSLDARPMAGREVTGS
jgi:hypothetical protein